MVLPFAVFLLLPSEVCSVESLVGFEVPEFPNSAIKLGGYALVFYSRRLVLSLKSHLFISLTMGDILQG